MLHQVGVLFDLYYDARKHENKVSVLFFQIVWIIEFADQIPTHIYFVFHFLFVVSLRPSFVAQHLPSIRNYCGLVIVLPVCCWLQGYEHGGQL